MGHTLYSSTDMARSSKKSFQSIVRHTLRYSELRREMGDITDAVLASTLKGLIENGMVARKAYVEIPPHVEYSLTPKGASVVPILQSICQWAGAFYNDVPTIQCKRCDHK